MNLCDCSVGAIVAHLLKKTRIEFGGIDQLSESRLRIGVGDDCARAKKLSVSKQDALRLTVVNLDAVDFGAGTEFCAGFLRGLGQRLRQRAHAAFHEYCRRNSSTIG